MKKLLILGAGIYQVPLIRRAREMGIYTIIASIPGKYPGFVWADKVYYADTTDKVALLQIAEAEKIDGVAVCGTDVCVPSQGFLCDQLGLTGPTENAALLAQNKEKMKAAFKLRGVRTARSEYVKLNCCHPTDVCEKLGYPVIFKSVDSSGSRGITRVEREEQISYAYDQVRENTRADGYLIEEYLIGKEFGAQAFIYHGELRFVLPHGDIVFQGETGVPIGHYVPIDLSSDIAKDAEEQLRKAVDALGVDNCAINADFILSNGKPYVLEIGARSGATCLAEMTGIYYGFDYYEKIIQAALGMEPDFSPSNKRRQANAELLLTAERDGIIRSFDLNVKDEPRIVDCSLDYAVGDPVRRFAKGPDRIGQIIAIGETAEEAKKTIDNALKHIRIDIGTSYE